MERNAGHDRLGNVQHRVLRRLPKYLVTSREPIRATFSNGLTVGVIPMRLVVRLDVAPSTCAFVVHGGSTPQDVRGPVESHTFRETGA